MSAFLAMRPYYQDEGAPEMAMAVPEPPGTTGTDGDGAAEQGGDALRELSDVQVRSAARRARVTAGREERMAAIRGLLEPEPEAAASAGAQLQHAAAANAAARSMLPAVTTWAVAARGSVVRHQVPYCKVVA